jgi:hypothetical protein
MTFMASLFVTPGLDPGVHVDHRVKPGDDEERERFH